MMLLNFLFGILMIIINFVYPTESEFAFIWNDFLKSTIVTIGAMYAGSYIYPFANKLLPLIVFTFLEIALLLTLYFFYDQFWYEIKSNIRPESIVSQIFIIVGVVVGTIYVWRDFYKGELTISKNPIAKKIDRLHTTRLQQLIIDESDDKGISAASRKLLELAAFLIPIKPQMAKSYVERFYNDRTIIEFAIFFYWHFEIYLIGILDDNFRGKMDRIRQDYIGTFSKVHPNINFEELIKDRLILYQKRCAEVRAFFDETVKTFCLLVFETQDSKKFSLHADDFIMLSSSAIENMLFEKQIKDYLQSLDHEGKLEFLKLRTENLFR